MFILASLPVPSSLLNLSFQLCEAFKYLFRGGSVFHFLMHNFLVAVQGKVVTLGCDVGFWHAEALFCPGTFEFAVIALLPAGKDIRQVIFRVLVLRKLC